MAQEFAPGSFDLGTDEITGTRTRMHFDNDGKLHIENVTPIAAIAEQNKALANEVSRTTRSGDMVRVARIDMQTLLDLHQRGILRDKTAMRKWLASDEAKPFKTHWMAS